MHGNRDFFIRKRFAKETGITLLKEPSVINLYGEPILLLHGDSLCTLDERHQNHERSCTIVFINHGLLLPLNVRRHYGARYRSASAERKSHLPNNIMDVTPDEVIRVMSEANVKTLVHGHTHRPAIHKLSIDNKNVKRIVLGAWHDKGTYLRVDQDNTVGLLDTP